MVRRAHAERTERCRRGASRGFGKVASGHRSRAGRRHRGGRRGSARQSGARMRPQLLCTYAAAAAGALMAAFIWYQLAYIRTLEQALDAQQRAAQNAGAPPPVPPSPTAGAPEVQQGVLPAPGPAPVQETPSAAQQATDWRVPPGPIPPRPEKMPRWFKFQQPEQWCTPGPHNKVRSNRVAAIVVNYNMVERADNIAEGIKKYVKWPVDVIVVDNGSDLKDSPPSKHTAIRLEANVQTANGWLMGVEYAKALSHAYGYCYMAYWIWITTSEYVEKKDILTPMAEAMIADPQIAGVSPHLSADSLPKTWPQLYKQKGTTDTDIKDVSFLDNLATLWRAEWFDSIGVFDPDELRGFGVDFENSYLAKVSGRRVVVHQGVSIRKTSGVAYKMKRMNADKNTRGDVATKEMRNLLGHRYGGGKFETGYTQWAVMAQKDPGFSRMNKDGVTLEVADFDRNPLSYFTNRRGTWFDDYTRYEPYEAVPQNVPLFQFPLPAGTKLEASGTKGLVSHGLQRRRRHLADADMVQRDGINETAGEPGTVYELQYRGEYDEYYAFQRAVLAAEGNHTALQEELELLQSIHDEIE